ncbi:uncharacterized protein LOC121242840 [Juglans microcarpa x Juglans regia]|uniref:uncharacterized protein LOC121242840 n=1 Tax=Juglans microcarpa x Juglans regia TaxID=2249226 RepID=UPI001B7E415A|nr:uncharacterized protein LOC121242840 [Juglans microcarpa x Juglans regia]
MQHVPLVDEEQPSSSAGPMGPRPSSDEQVDLKDGQPLTLELDLENKVGEVGSAMNNQLVEVMELNVDGLSMNGDRMTVVNEGAPVEQFIPNVCAAMVKKEKVDEAKSEGESDRDRLKDDMRKDYCSDSEKPWKTGVGSSRSRLKKIIKNYRPNIVALAEPFLMEDKIPNYLETFSWSNQFVSVKVEENGFTCILIIVYAKCNSLERKFLWEDLVASSNSNYPWLVCADFNNIKEDSDRKGGQPRPFAAMEDFNLCIQNRGLLDMSSMGSRMTWCNGQRGLARSWARLDRCFIDTNFLNCYPNMFYQVLSCTSSDHSPLVLQMGDDPFRYGPSPFRFQYMWTDHVNFLGFVEGVWNQEGPGFGFCKLSFKLKRMKFALRDWNQRVFGRTNVIISDLETRIDTLETCLQNSFSVEDDNNLLATNLDLLTWKGREDIRLSHMAKKSWLKDGDQNSKFFHAYLKAKFRKRVTDVCLADGTLLQTPLDIHQAVVDYFKKILGEYSSGELPNLGDFMFPVISDNENLMLCSIPSIEDIKAALFSIPIDSSLGLDGFGSGFFRVDKPNGFDKFRPISLCSVFYKICSKIIMGCLTNLPSKLISQEQGAFIPGHSIFDNISLTQEMARGTPFISHLMYADDIVIFANGGNKSMKSLMEVLHVYELWTGVFPFKYLGVPIVVSRLKVCDFGELLGKVSKKIAGWKMKLLSAGGRVILLHHVLSSMATHLLAVLQVPKGVLLALNRILSSFFWGASDGKGKHQWVAWHSICTPTEEGGLGIRDFGDIQKALHMKFARRLIQVQSLWTDFFRGKYVQGNHLSLLNPNKGTWFWKSIIRSIPEVLNNSKWMVREGNISFWYDNWEDGGPLSAHHQVIENPLLKIKECWVDDGWDIPLLERLMGKVKGQMEDLNHVMCTGDFARQIWRLAATHLGVHMGVFQTWKEQANFWFRRAGNSSQLRIIFGLLPSIRLDISVLVPKPKQARVVRWLRPPQGWMKLNSDGSSLGNPGPAGAGG